MRKIKYLLLFSFLLNLGCVKDNSSTTENELNSVVISGMEKVYNVVFGNTLKIDPVVLTKTGDDSKLDYLWYKYDLGMTKADTMSREKNLSVVIDDVPTGVESFIVFKVVDRTTGVFYINKSSLYTKAKYSDGIVALTKDGDKIDLAFVKEAEGKDPIVEMNLFSLNNPGVTLNPSTNKVFFTDAVDVKPGEFRRIVIATNDEKIGMSLNPDGFENMSDLSDLFSIPLATGKNYNLGVYGQDNGSEIMVIDGKVYDRLAGPWESGTLFNPAVISSKSPNYNVSPIFISVDGNNGSPMFFDNVSGGFMCYTGGGSFQYLSEGPKFKFTHFDPNKLLGMELVAAGTTAVVDDETIGDWYTLLKDKNTGNFRMLSFTYGYDYEVWKPFFETQWDREISKSDCPMLYQATQIIGGDRIYPRTSYPWTYPRAGFAGMMFYLANNSVYVYNVGSGSEIKLIDGNASGFTIDKIVTSRVSSIDEEGQIVYNPRFGLCIRDNAATTKKGGVAFYNISLLGGIHAIQYFKKVGFCDQVIDFDEKLN